MKKRLLTLSFVFILLLGLVPAAAATSTGTGTCTAHASSAKDTATPDESRAGSHTVTCATCGKQKDGGELFNNGACLDDDGDLQCDLCGRALTPVYKIDDGTQFESGYWIVSYNGGATWYKTAFYALGQSSGDAAAGNGVDGKDGRDGRDGKDGKDGRDGVDGVDGVDGRDGHDGHDGKDGADGITPSIGENGNWFLGDTDTGVSARGTAGTDGTDGQDGIGLEAVEINDAGELVLTRTDGTTLNLGSVVGAKGANGKDGKDGADGTDGITPSIGENGNWFLGDTDTGVRAEAAASDSGEAAGSLFGLSDRTLIFVALGVAGVSLLGNIILLLCLLIRKKKAKA